MTNQPKKLTHKAKEELEAKIIDFIDSNQSGNIKTLSTALNLDEQLVKDIVAGMFEAESLNMKRIETPNLDDLNFKDLDLSDYTKYFD
ncbi:MAG: hypothetical protein MPEBLZ_02054 [Candidatus Methanoperedens nitroreducens]|uniref:Uncharacterized protein n=1 Tax=Candidatus Methanoperedens nitratireducens TaxID=1392998 RepID=A0A0P8A5I3_9EURY|nr:MAG: hypothetical protein MPEBLZ_02054 [Candidatus Methanoperedens sp. BLZ1]